MKKYLIFIFMLTAISLFCNENTDFQHGKIRMNKFNFNMIDENDNMIKLYDKIAIRIINPDYSELFSYNKKMRILFNEFVTYLHNADILLNLGIAFSIITPTFTVSIIGHVVAVIVGIAAGATLFLSAVGCMIAYAVFIHKAYKTMEKLIKYYNEDLEMTKIKNISKFEYNLISFKF